MTLQRLRSGLCLFILAVILIALSNRAMAGDVPGSFSFRSYGPDQGLRNQAVTCIEQDREGFIFVGTEDGLFRYDGTRFERFGTAEGLPSDSITLLYRELSGRLWVATRGGLVVWVGRRPDPSVKGPFLPQEQVDGISASGAGHLVVATATGIFEGGPEGLAPIVGLTLKGSCAAWISADGSELLVTNQGRIHRRGAGTSWTSRELAPAFQNESVQTLLKDRAGWIWMRGRRTLVRLASFEGPVENLSSRLPGAAVQKGTLVQDSQDRIWAPTNLGLGCFESSKMWVLSEAMGLPTQWATAVLMDREGSLWVASEGVHRLQGRLAWTTQTRRHKLPSDTVWGIFRSREGALWAGTNRGLAHAIESGWITVPGTLDRSFYAFAEGPDGGFWVGGNNAKETRNALLYRAPGSNSFQSVPMESIEGPSTVNSLAFGPDGALYIATVDHGLRRLTANGQAFHIEAVALPMGDAKEQINQLLKDPEGRLWAAGMSGLACFDGANWRRFGTKDGLREIQVEAMALDPGGEIWVSYWNTKGLTRFKLDAQGGRASLQVDGPPELVEDNIYSLGFDTRGALWLGTAQGIKRWNNGKVERFGRGEGLPGEDASANAFWADRNGDVWLGMASGMAHFQTDRDQAPPMPPATKVLMVKDGSGRSLEAPLPEVGWRDRAVTFRFSALSFLNEARVRYQVRLAGFEDSWRATDNREARYTGLPPGRFRFEVRACLDRGEFGPPSGRDVIILAPWWLTGWAVGLGIAGFAGLLALLYRWRLGRLHRRNDQLEALVHARTGELEEANLALQAASMVDPLTGLKNRRFLDISMPEELARMSRQRRRLDGPDRSLANANMDMLFFMVDLDHFKTVNDTYGHAAGDLVLRQASEAIRMACREADMVVRWGGEEFLIVARNTERSAAILVAQKLWSAIRELTFDVGHGVTLRKTCSIGFSAFPVIEGSPNLFTWEEAIELADQCLYAAKNSGRDGWVGVLVSDGAKGERARLFRDLAGLATEGYAQILTSFPPETMLRWNTE